MSPTPSNLPTSDDSKQNFKSIFPRLVDMLVEDVSSTHSLPASTVAYIRYNLEYNVPHGKLTRGLALYQCYKAFIDHKPSAEEEYFANILGWCVELQQAFFLVADDIMDDSLTRRGQSCFYRLPNIGLNAINDAMMLESMIYRVLRLVFGDNKQYVALVQLFQDITFTTEVGQLLDLTSQEDGPVQFDGFTDEVLARIYRYKTSHYTFFLPVALGMRLANVSEKKYYETAKAVCLEMGHYFQAQDDYLDAFGDPAVTGKVGTDIEEKTCTWLVVQALKVCSAEDREIMEANYGIKDKECSDKVKDVYRKLKVPEAFREFEQQSYEQVRNMISEVKDMPTGAFEFLLSKIYKREK